MVAPPAGGWNWASRSVAAGRRAGETEDAGILLPKDAVIGAVYCGSTAKSGATTECWLAGCDFPASMTLDDDLYTEGRALTFSFASQARDGRHGEVFHLWVRWRRR